MNTFEVKNNVIRIKLMYLFKRNKASFKESNFRTIKLKNTYGIKKQYEK